MREMMAVIALAVLLMCPCAAQEPASQPATRPTETPATQPAETPASQPTLPSNEDRLNDLLALIQGQNSGEVRRTVARELLMQQWDETPARLATVLGSGNGPARTAVALTLAELPRFLDPRYIDPLMNMLVGPDAEVSRAAAAALAAYRDNGVAPRLRQLAQDANQPRATRLAAAQALGLMTRRTALEGLIGLLDDSDEVVASAALTALEQAAAIDFGGDRAAAKAWWDASRSLSLEAWQQLQIERLVRKDRDVRRRLEAVETRLADVLEAGFKRAADAERGALLAGFLGDDSPAIRLLGLTLAQLHLSEGKTLPEKLCKRARELLDSTDPREQAAAIRTVVNFRDSQDGERFLALLSKAGTRDVRLALVNGLGYVGSGSAAGALLAVLKNPEHECTTEAVAALGRLAERGVLADGDRPAVAEALLAVFEQTNPAQVVLRERVVWAMGNIAATAFGPAYATALGPDEAVAVRQAAARGISALNDPAWADALAGAVNDPDAGVRKTVIETLAMLGSSSHAIHLTALWDYALADGEADESLHQVAWRGVLAILARGTPEDLEHWLDEMPSDRRPPARLLELLEGLAKIVRETEPIDHAFLGVVQVRVALLHLAAKRPAEGLAAYQSALGELYADKSERAPAVAQELFRLALLGGRYDATVAAALAHDNPAPDCAALWEIAKAEITKRLESQRVGEGAAMLELVAANPPGAWPEPIVQAIDELRARVAQLQTPPPEPAAASQPATQPTEPASQPASQPTSQPTTAPTSQPA